MIRLPSTENSSETRGLVELVGQQTKNMLPMLLSRKRRVTKQLTSEMVKL